LLALSGCATTPPTTVENACRIFAEKGDWYQESLAAENMACLFNFNWQLCVKNQGLDIMPHRHEQPF
jgi:hypothetical protein